MVCFREYTENERRIIAAHWQRYDKKLTGVKFRHNWAYQEDFGEYYLQCTTPRRYVYMTVEDDFFCISKLSINSETMGWSSEQIHEFRPILHWEPLTAPDGGHCYSHHCLMCNEGLQNRDSECMACGFMECMLSRTNENEKALQKHAEREQAIFLN